MVKVVASASQTLDKIHGYHLPVHKIRCHSCLPFSNKLCSHDNVVTTLYIELGLTNNITPGFFCLNVSKGHVIS